MVIGFVVVVGRTKACTVVVVVVRAKEARRRSAGIVIEAALDFPEGAMNLRLRRRRRACVTGQWGKREREVCSAGGYVCLFVW